ncbi:beta strand repeat-containing protein [Lacipirellula parvula]|uniref:beta strand repeat-containing protein n=1 Tax=Lacipirellula parvula TaxID=2650471 RepID=UPI0015622A97|nr:autotransporter-associated beta strand repeat-containing protein [Lacipirellula parvula]
MTCFVAATAVVVSSANAATYTWTGAAGDGLWSGLNGLITNWSPNALPSASQSIAFTTNTPTPTVNLQTDRTINDVTFGGTQPYVLTGGTLTVASGAINVNGGATAVTHDIRSPLTLGAAGVFNVAGPATLSIERGVTDGVNSYGLIKTGAGTLTLSSQTSNLHSLAATEGVLNIDATNVSTRLVNDFAFNFQTTVNVTHGATLANAPASFLRIGGVGRPVLTLDGEGTTATGSVYFLAGHGGGAGVVDIRNRAAVSTGIFIVGIDDEGPLGSAATIRERATLTADAFSIGGSAGSIGTVTVSDANTLVQAGSILIGGYHAAAYGGVATMTVNKNAQAIANTETRFFTTTSTLIVDRATFTTPRLGTYVGAIPLIQLANAGSTAALQITNDDVATTTTYAGAIADVPGGSGGIRKTGAGNQILAGTSTYTGGTRIEAGTLTLGVSNALPTTGAVTIAGGALELAGNMQKTGAVTLAGGAINTSSPAFLLPASMTLQSGTLAAPTISSGAVSKTTASMVTVNAPLTASLVTVSAGTLILNQGVTTAAVQVNGGTLQAAGMIVGDLASAPGSSVVLTGATTFKGNTTLSGALTVGYHSLVSDSQALTVGALTILGGNVLANAGVNVNGAASGFGTVIGTVSGPVGASWTASGGTLTLGDARYINGFSGFNGTLAAGAHQLNLLSGGFANLGSLNTLAGGTLASLNGLNLLSGRRLTGFGSVQGAFLHQGAVTGGSGEDVLLFTGAVSGPGSFAGNVRFDGSYSPGFGITAVNFENLALTANSRLDIEIGGMEAGSQFDQLNAAGALSLDGVLRVSLLGDFAPTAGQSFDLLNWATLSGQFASLQLPQLSGLFWDRSQLYTTGVLLVVAQLEADFNSDGAVDGADLAAWKAGFGANSPSRAQGDANADGRVDGADFMLWQRQAGMRLSATAAASIPEPSTLTLIAMLFAIRALNRRNSPFVAYEAPN